MSVRRPPRVRPAAGLRDHAGQTRPVHVHDPDLVIADECEASSVGRPLRVADRQFRGRDLHGRTGGAAQGQREQLSGASGLRGVGDDTVSRVDPELAG